MKTNKVLTGIQILISESIQKKLLVQLNDKIMVTNKDTNNSYEVSKDYYNANKAKYDIAKPGTKPTNSSPQTSKSKTAKPKGERSKGKVVRADLTEVNPGDSLLLSNNKKVKVVRITKIDGVPFLIFSPQFIVKTKSGNRMGINMINQNTGTFGPYKDSAPGYSVVE